jgi:molecular chaperone DnaK
MPALRRRVSEALATTFAEGNDPMTLVAQGAALYAATAGLEAREPTPKASPGGRKVWLQFPAMSSDLTPHVLGRFTPGEGPGPTSLRLVRGDGLWHSPKVTVEPDGTFVTTVELTPRRASVFTLEARGPAGENVPAAPGTFTIVQGMTITDPPLSRTVGVATADNRVRVYFERGAPLPARRTFTLRTVDTVAARSAESALRVPVVQGEFEQASLCRLVGALELSGQGLTASLPAGSEVEVTLELDRGGRLSARALVPSTGNVFEEVAQLVVPEASPEALGGLAQALRARVAELRTGAFRRGTKATIERLNRAGAMLSDAERDTLAAQGGDTDSAQRARRTLLELDALLEECDFDQRWPALEDEARLEVSYAGRWVSSHGTAQEQTLLREAVEAVERARKDRAVRELQRQLRVVKNLGDTAFYRDPDTWPRLFEGAASRADDCRDLPRARQLVDEGRRALTREDLPAVRRCTEALWKLLPTDAARRREGYDSGVR